ncbi:MAG TPA: hypothetical protein VEJ41_00910 [Candidatus Acidoferrales bacterium]|nr:hypothetical protein [Candidatus Acidoferrales bacterium]
MRVTVCLFAVAALSLLSGCSSSGDESAPATPVHFQQRAVPNQAIALSVDGSIGVDVSLSGTSDEVVRLDATQIRGASGLRLTQRSSPSWLVLRLDPRTHARPLRWLFGGDDEAKIYLSVPSEATVSVDAVNGPVRSDGVRGPLAVRIVNGPIEINGAGSVLSLRVVNGPIDANVSDTSRTPNIDINGTNGSIDVVVPKDFHAMVEAHTLVGPLVQDVGDSQGPGTVTVHLVAGPVTIEEH